jgi:hypothetical protein
MQFSYKRISQKNTLSHEAPTRWPGDFIRGEHHKRNFCNIFYTHATNEDPGFYVNCFFDLDYPEVNIHHTDPNMLMERFKKNAPTVVTHQKIW